MKTYKIKNEKYEETVNNEGIKEAEKRKIDKLIKQLKAEKVINPKERGIDEMIERLSDVKSFAYGETKNIKYYVSKRNGFYIHKQFYKEGVKVYDTVRFFTEDGDYEFKKNMDEDPLI